ncbi:MAG: heavy-metal-associated domain-containing protein [Saprospiraceae bacterium]|nr:heavy-metal-associated domain-containing protein [Saprospiraceae bacterium]
MKILIFICIAIFVAPYGYAQQPANKSAVTGSTVTTVANSQTAHFQVWGNCGMCKKTIEKAAKSVNGVQTANWNMDTHEFTVVFDNTETDVEKVHKAIALAGYDTDLVKSDDEAYSNLPGCCQYERRKM